MSGRGCVSGRLHLDFITFSRDTCWLRADAEASFSCQPAASQTPMFSTSVMCKSQPRRATRAGIVQVTQRPRHSVDLHLAEGPIVHHCHTAGSLLVVVPGDLTLEIFGDAGGTGGCEMSSGEPRNTTNKTMVPMVVGARSVLPVAHCNFRASRHNMIHHVLIGVFWEERAYNTQHFLATWCASIDPSKVSACCGVICPA